jgi:hypothetical protein
MRSVVAVGICGLVLAAMAACGSEAASSDTARQPPTAATSASATSSRSSASASPALFATGCGEGLVDLSGPLTGTWRGDDDGVYYLRQTGDCLWWFGTSFAGLDESGGRPSWGWANVAVGRIVDDAIYLEWSDVLGEFLGRGTLTLRISGGGDRIEKVDELRPGLYGGSSWDRIRPQASAAAP